LKVIKATIIIIIIRVGAVLQFVCVSNIPKKLLSVSTRNLKKRFACKQSGLYIGPEQSGGNICHGIIEKMDTSESTKKNVRKSLCNVLLFSIESFFEIRQK